MRHRLRFLLPLPLIAAAALVIAGCGDDDDDSATDAATQQAPAAEGDSSGRYGGGPGKDSSESEKSGGDKAGSDSGGGKEASGTAIKLASSPVGDALFDADDQAIYLFDIEDGPESECYDDCAEAWPPVLTKGDPVANGPVKQGLLGTTKRDDGTTQVTYNDHPLYYYANEGPGELRCHNIPGFGGLWLALDESGDALPA